MVLKSGTCPHETTKEHMFMSSFAMILKARNPNNEVLIMSARLISELVIKSPCCACSPKP